MRRSYFLLAVIIAITTMSTVLTWPKVKLIEEYRNKAINPIDVALVDIDKMLNDIGTLSNIDDEKYSLISKKPLIQTVIELCIFDNSTFSDIFSLVLITSTFYCVLIYKLLKMIFSAIKNNADSILIILLVSVLIPSGIFGIYFIGILGLLIVAAFTAIVSARG